MSGGQYCGKCGSEIYTNQYQPKIQQLHRQNSQYPVNQPTYPPQQMYPTQYDHSTDYGSTSNLRVVIVINWVIVALIVGMALIVWLLISIFASLGSGDSEGQFIAIYIAGIIVGVAVLLALLNMQLSKHNNAARIIFLVLSILSIISQLVSMANAIYTLNIPIALYNIYVVYVLGFDKETIRLFDRHNI